MLYVFTLVTRNHLHRARLVMADVARHLPDAQRVTFLADDPGGLFDPAAEPFEVITPPAYAPARHRHLAFALEPYALCGVLKPTAMLHLHRRDPRAIVLYLDSDTSLLARPTELLEAADRHPFVLTPHILDPERNQFMNLMTLRSGAFNAGVLGCGASPVAERLLSWWIHNVSEPARATEAWLYEQGWLSFVPALFPAAHVLRHPAYNVAFWNLHERAVQRDPATGRLSVEGHPLVVYHFSFFDRRQPGKLAGRISDCLPALPAELEELFRGYAERLREHGAEECERWSCEFASFRDGRRVTARHRAYFASRLWSNLPATVDPFDPRLKLPGLGGLKSLYHADHPVTRAIRRLRNTASQA